MSIRYSIRKGDTLSAIARSHGMTWQELYNHIENADFRRKRPNPNLIYPGDVIMIPQRIEPPYEVPGLTLIPQQDNNSCWYASAQMLIHWKMNRLRQSLAGLVPPEFDAQCRQIKDAGGGIVNAQILAMVKRLGLRAVPPMSPAPQALRSWLVKYGPLWVNGKSHIVVIAGINGMQVKVYDPWPPKMGKIDWRPLTDWYVGGKNPAGQPDSSRDTDASVTTVFLYVP